MKVRTSFPRAAMEAPGYRSKVEGIEKDGEVVGV
jgi:hypothetical protein